MYPHERSLVKKMEGKPFALIGVNTDQEAATVKSAIQSENITWRSFMDGSTTGPISSAWQIRGFPLLYVIDAKGIIRRKFEGAPRGEVLDQLIDELVKEAVG